MTSSTLGLVFGLFGVLVSAAFNYGITLSASTTNEMTWLLDPQRPSVVLSAFKQLTDYPPAFVPLLIVLPFISVIQLMVVILCGLTAKRRVGPWLISTPRAAWLIVFFLLTGYGILGCLAYPDFAHGSVRLWDWLGCGIVTLSLAIPHHSVENSD